MSELTENQNKEVIKTLTPQNAFELIKNHKELTLIDIRTPEEFSRGHVDGAENLDYYSEDFEKQLEKIDKEKKYMIYCGSGVRSTKTSRLMEDMGFVDLYTILGGFAGWKINKLPVTH